MRSRTSIEEQREVRPQTANPAPAQQRPARASTPFVVEELSDDYGTAG
jgi:hypothetical protein